MKKGQFTYSNSETTLYFVKEKKYKQTPLKTRQVNASLECNNSI